MFDPARRAHYFHCGRDAIRLIELGLLSIGVPDIRRVLDLPSGAGRVTRHLVRYFPDASITACDLEARHVDFCARQFAVRPHLSNADLRAVAFPEPFDLIWCGSLLTHLPADRVADLIALVARSLADGGVGLVTTHGRWAVFRQAHTPHPYVPPEHFAEVTTLASGFGFTGYPNTEAYGISWAMPSYLLAALEGLPELRVVGFVERGWDNHQDVVMVQKRRIDARPWIFEDAPAD
jgi:SAM-dependent methyltransferase